MEFTLEDLNGPGDPKPTNKGAKTAPLVFTPEDLENVIPEKGNLGSTGRLDTSVNFSKYRFQPRVNADNNLLRAQDQGFWESLGLTVANTLVNIPLGIIEQVGTLGTLADTGSNRDYSNALTEAMKEWKNPFGEVYRENPNEVFDMGDSAWWFNNLGGLVESAAAFGVGGAGVAKSFGTIAQLVAKGSKLAGRIAQGASAATMAYMEGALSGAEVYERAYNTNYMKLYQGGMDPNEATERAKKLASQAAATVVQLNTIMNTGLNMTAFAPIFRDTDQLITSWWTKNGVRKPGESRTDWLARVEAVAPEGSDLKKLVGAMSGWQRLGLESVQEGIEEVNTQYAERIGESIAAGEEQKSLGEYLTDVNRYFEEVLDAEGGLNFALGALGGVAQTVILDNVPIHKVQKFGSDGKPLVTEEGANVMHRVSSRTRDKMMNREYFDNIKDALVKDMKWFGEKNKQLEQALATGDLATAGRVKADLLSVHHLHSISKGLSSVWENEYDNIASIDNTKSLGDQFIPQIEALTKQMQDAFNNGDVDTANLLNAQRTKLQEQQAALADTTEAMQKGFAADKNDNEYKERAFRAKEDLRYLNGLYNQMQDRFTGDPDYDQVGLAEHMFYRHANLYLHKRELDKQQADLDKLKARVDAIELTPSDDVLVKNAQQILEQQQVLQTNVKSLNREIELLNKSIAAKDNTTLQAILEKYNIPVTAGAPKKLANAIETRKKDLMDKIAYSDKELKDTMNVWKEANPGKDIDEAFKQAATRPVLSDIYLTRRAAIEEGFERYNIAREQLAADSTRKGIENLIKASKPPASPRKDKEHIDAYNQQIDREIAANLDAKQKQAMVDRIAMQIQKLDETLAQRRRDIAVLDAERSRIKGAFKNILRVRSLSSKRKDIEAEVNSMLFERRTLQQRMHTLGLAASKAATEAANVERKPDLPSATPTTRTPVTAPAAPAPAETTTTTPVSDPVTEEEEAVVDETGEDFLELADTSIAQPFTTLEEGHPVFDSLVGGTELGDILRSAIRIKRDSSVQGLVELFKTYIERVGMPLPSQSEIDVFVIPYITELVNTYRTAKPTAEEDYLDIRQFLTEEAKAELDRLETQFNTTGFDARAVQDALTPFVKSRVLDSKVLPLVINRMEAYMKSLPPITVTSETDPIIESPAETTSTGFTLDRFIDEMLPMVGTTDSAWDWTVEFPGISKADQLKGVEDIRSNKLYRGNPTAAATKVRAALEEMYNNEAIPMLRGRGANVERMDMPISEMFPDFVKTEQVRQEETTTEREVTERPDTELATIPDSEPTFIPDAAMDIEIVETVEKMFAGAANINAVKANFNTHPYRTYEMEDGTIRTRADYTTLEPKVNPAVLIPNGVVVGEEVTFQVDTTWVGSINYDNELVQDDFGEDQKRADSFANYTDVTGKILMQSTPTNPLGGYANVPIAIVNGKGEKIGYVPRADWIIARFPDTGNYRHVTDEYRDENGNLVTDNVKLQYSRVIKLRQAIAQAYNVDPNFRMKTRVSERGAGHIMMNREVNRNTGEIKSSKKVKGKEVPVLRSAAKMLPDKSLKIAILKEGSPEVGSGVRFDGELNRLPAYMANAKSMPVVLLPAPNGKFTAAPLYTRKLGDTPASLNTVVIAIQTFLRAQMGKVTDKDKKVILRIYQECGFDLTSPNGLRDFIQQYFTYTQKFGERDTVMLASESKTSAREEFMLDIANESVIDEQKALIKIGTRFSGEKPLYATLDREGNLHPDFVEYLKAGLSNRFKNVVFQGGKLKGINDPDKFKAPIIRSDGNVAITEYDSYNEYVKASSATFVYGLNKVNKDQYVYIANSTIQLDYHAALETALPAVSGTIQAAEPVTEDPITELFGPAQEADSDVADLFGVDGMLDPSMRSVPSMPVPNQGEPVSLELLEELLNFTPEVNRNGKSPEQVLRELLEKGITVLAEGHNPFRKC